MRIALMLMALALPFIAEAMDSHEKDHLLLFKSGIVDYNGFLGEWRNTTDMCTWPGVGCGRFSRHVRTLDLSGMNLTGVISDHISNLKYLRVLNLSSNGFTGRFPDVIFNLTSLRMLAFDHNLFGGEFPLGVSQLTNLVSFTAYSNNFTGPLPVEFSEMSILEFLDLGGSYFSGSIPASYGKMQSLKFLRLSGNSLSGRLPRELGQLGAMKHMEIGYNAYEGGVPAEFGKMTELEFLDISDSGISGTLPPELGKLGKVKSLFLFKNKLNGSIPSEFGNMKWLVHVDLSDNELTGEIPRGFSDLQHLTLLHLMRNNLSGTLPPGLGELSKLVAFEIWNNSFSGILPQNLGKYSALREFDVSSNGFTGPIPPNLCGGKKLYKLIMFSNRFSGNIPESLGRCPTLYRFRIEDNVLEGPIPKGLGTLPNLTYVDLSMNNLTGGIPENVCWSRRVQKLNVSYNPHLGGALPREIWSTPNLQVFSAAYTGMSGTLPSFKSCGSVYTIELTGNAIYGKIPKDITQCHKLLSIQLARNKLSGSVPVELVKLPCITEIDVSHNALTGAISPEFDDLTTLEFFNVSFNNLTGEIPSSGALFRNMSISAFTGNPGLCGGVLRPCYEPTAPEVQDTDSQKRQLNSLAWILGSAVAFSLCAVMVATRCFYKHKYYMTGYKTEREEGPWKITAFQRLNFNINDILECVKSSNIIGMGSAGTVYRADMPNGETIAVKKLWKNSDKLTNKKKRGVLAEVDLLGKVRHRNIVRLLGCCAKNDETLLLYEFMPNGSLADLLHGTRNKASSAILSDWTTRYKIAVGVAQGLKYLHHDYYPIVVHRDVKPSNILLDADMEARVADFGVAKLIQTDESMSVIAGSYGYIAPEYAYTLQVDEKSDIYSFGVVLLELLTGKKSVETEYGEAMNIVDWVREKVQSMSKEGVMEILDKSIGAGCTSVREEMVLVLRVALLCTARCPEERPSMRDVVSMLAEAMPKRKAVLDMHYLHQQQQQFLRNSNPSSQASSPSPIPSPIASKILS